MRTKKPTEKNVNKCLKDISMDKDFSIGDEDKKLSMISGILIKEEGNTLFVYAGKKAGWLKYDNFKREEITP